MLQDKDCIYAYKISKVLTVSWKCLKLLEFRNKVENPENGLYFRLSTRNLENSSRRILHIDATNIIVFMIENRLYIKPLFHLKNSIKLVFINATIEIG